MERKSFYNGMTGYMQNMTGRQIGNKSCWIYETDKYLFCKSYNTLVACIDMKKHIAYVRGWYSVTTSRHVNQFLRDHDFNESEIKKIKEENTGNHDFWQEKRKIMDKNGVYVL